MKKENIFSMVFPLSRWPSLCWVDRNKQLTSTNINYFQKNSLWEPFKENIISSYLKPNFVTAQTSTSRKTHQFITMYKFRLREYLKGVLCFAKGKLYPTCHGHCSHCLCVSWEAYVQRSKQSFVLSSLSPPYMALKDGDWSWRFKINVMHLLRFARTHIAVTSCS